MRSMDGRISGSPHCSHPWALFPKTPPSRSQKKRNDRIDDAK
jgi:hypothetical protein